MCCKSWKSSLPFALTFLVSIFVVSAFVNRIQKEAKFIYVDGHSYGYSDERNGSGLAVDRVDSCGEKKFAVNCLACKDGIKCEESTIEKTSNLSKSYVIALKVLSKPKAIYTDEARQNQIQGTVTLRVVFLKTGEIGEVQTVNGLPYGLTEQAVLAAKNIKFNPVRLSGEPINAVKLVQYTFTLY